MERFLSQSTEQSKPVELHGEAWAAQDKSLPAGHTLILGGIIPCRTVLLSIDCHDGVPVVL